MLQPRLTPRNMSRHRPARCHTLAQSSICRSLSLMALIVTLLATPPFGATQSPDDLYIVRPTPALRVASDDLTTVLLVNNEAGRVGDNHGRFLSVRPEVGLLTSTARTFIQEGITTEYATQVVGTTLDNGRLYAQYLKKSSRVLFENGHVAPSVVTSWVGEGGQTRSYLQSHNDLFNADDADWQDLDDRLGVFVGNTDFVRAKAGSASSQALPLAANNPGETAASYSVSTSSSSAKQVPVVQLVGRSGHIEENARKLAAQKVLPIGDLPTYTVKNHFEPSGYTSNGDIGVVVEQQVSSSVSSPDDKDDGRSPKVYYQQLMTERNDLKPGAAATFKAQSLPKRVLSTVTYYGFADFTTVVGDSVIVFSPSTAQPSGNFGHVTSIKGKATLSANHAQNVPQASVESSQPQATIEATKIVDEIQIVPTKVNSLAVGVVTTSAINDSTDIKDENDDTTPAIDVSESTPELTTPTTITTPTTPTSPKEEVPQKVAEDASTIKVKPMFSLPTDQEILEIYASLSKAQAQTEVTKDSTSSSVSVQNVEAVTAQIKAETTQSNLQVHGGATTIFFEDDPFANFVEPTTTTSATILTTATTTTAETPSVKSVTPETSTEEATTVANEPDVSTTVEDSEEETTTAKAPAADQGIVTEKIVTVTDAPDVVVKEISPNETDTSALAGCSTTKQVFLTQLPKTLTILNTQILRPDGDSNEEETSIETSVLSTYEILETTKYYCIQATEVLEEAQRTDLPQLETPVDKDVKHAVTEATLTSTESTSEEDTTTVTTEAQSQEEMATTEVSEHDTSSTMKDDEGSEYDNEDYEVENDSDEVDLIYKTLYTTYTYLTTFFQGDSSTVSSHTEIVTNVITSTVGNEQIDVKPTDIVARIGENEISATQTVQSDIKPTVSKYMIPDELSSRLHDDETNTSEEQEQTISNDVTQRTSYLDDTIYTKTFFTTYTYFTTIFAEGETEIMSRTEVFTNFITKTEPVSASSNDFRTATPTDTVNAVLTQEQKSEKLTLSSQEQAITNAFKNVTGRAQDDNEDEHVTLVTDVRSSSSNGDQQLISKHNEPIDDQVSSESNTEEIIPSATLLLQTSFTTFTFYTTMYVGDNTNVISRLETVTNVATETLQPTRMIATEDATLPITYFTTFTYWTKLAKNGEITTISREETISNVIEPTNIAASSTNVPQTIEASAVPAQINDGNANSDQETEAAVIKPTATVPELTTYYTTYTYYTTSYDANKTITDSRFETITNVVTPTADLAPIDIASAASKEAGDTGSSGSTSSNAQSVINTSKLLLYDYKHIIDADGVSTLYFTTQIHSTVNEEGNGIEITSSTSSLYIDETKKANIPTPPPTDSPDDGSSSRQYKTGLVRLIEGTRIGNSTTTLYQSKVIGTVIDNRYAQIIESTSSFLFEKTTTPEEVQVSATISPTATDNTIVPTQQVSLAVTPAVVEGSISDGVSHEESEGTTEADPDADDDGKNKAKLPFQTKKRTFAPVIRPFASRNRPTFAPKQKTLSASSATIITRSDITPTITATPALKTVGRYASSRKGATSNIPIGLSESSSSRRTFGRPIKSSIGGNQPAGGLQSSSGFAPSRSRFASSSRAAPVSSSRRINPSFRPSSGLPFRSGFPSINLPNARPRIRPTASSGALPADSATATAQSTADSSAEEESSTQDQTNDEEETTTENSRRNQNPLLRFRRPLNRPSGFTPIPRPNANSAVTISPRRNPLSGRVKSPSTTTTTTTTARPRPLSFQRPTISSLQARTRPQSNLFPPRGLFQQQQKSQATDNAEIGQSEGEAENDSEYDDDEGDDESETNANRRRRQSNKSANHSRVRRQAEPLNRSRFRFRRPKTASTTTVEEPKSNEEINETTPAPRAKINSRFGSRYQSPHRESTTATTTSTHRSIRPTRPTSNRTQFTLREKDTTPKGLTRPGTTSNFRRQQPSTSSSLRRPGATTSSNRRLKSYSNHNTNNNVDNSGRTSSGSRTRNGNLSGSTRGRGSVRSRNRNEYNSDQQSTELGSVTITVTHVIPAEVTVPVVNGQITEYKNIVTGKTSTEVLGPHQYTNSVGNNGQTSLYLTREDSTVNFAGATEITRYLLHDSATTTITFTPTTIRGRKTSFSHVLPSTVYSVENVVSTVQPQISANAPLANILLSQLLLGNINLPSNPLLGALGGPAGAAAALTQQGSLPVAPTAIQNTPVTEYRTHTSTYVTTIFDGKSTVLPVTFQGKKILTTVYDTTAQTITATEFVTDTIVTTPTQMQQLQLQSAGQVAQVNSLLLQQLLLQQQQPLLEQPLQAITHTAAPNLFLTENLQDLDAHSAKAAGLGAHENIDDIDGLVPIVEDTQSTKSNRKKNRKSHKSHKRNKQQDARLPGEDSTVITLYVSGRTPGEFSTILSTVQNGYDHSASLHKRQAYAQIQQTTVMDSPEDLYMSEGSELVQLYLRPEETDESRTNGIKEIADELEKNALVLDSSESKAQTVSLESIVGDVGLWYAKATSQAQVVAPTEEAVAATSESKNTLEMRMVADDQLEIGSPLSNKSLDEARYHLATHVMSNGVELIIASDKLKHGEKQSTLPTRPNPHAIVPTQSHKPVTLAPSTLKNHMILALPSAKQENFTIPINANQFITKTCLTTYTYRTTYLENGSTTVESREKVISNIATEERDYFRASTEFPLGVTLSRTPELVVGVFPTTYRYYNTLIDNEQPLVITSSYTVVNTVTGPDDYISFLQPSEEATPTQDTNTYYSRVTLTRTMLESESEKIVTTENLLTQVVVTESLPARSTSVLKSLYAFDTDETHTLALGDKAGAPHVAASKTEELNDVHIYATKTFLTTFTYFTTTLAKDTGSTTKGPVEGVNGFSTIVPQSVATGTNYHTRVIENVVTDTVPSSLLRPELVSKFHTELMQKKGKHRPKVIVTMATLLGGETLEVTAVNILKPTKVETANVQQKTTTYKPKPNAELNTSFGSTAASVTQNESTKNVITQKSKSRNAIRPSLATKYSLKAHSTEAYTPLPEAQSSEAASGDLHFAESENKDVFVVPPSSSQPETNTGPSGSVSVLSPVDQLIGSFNFQRLRPVFNAMADLLQKNLVAKRPGPPSTLQPQPEALHRPIPEKETKSIPKNMTSNAERPIYIPVQGGDQNSQLYYANFSSLSDEDTTANKLMAHSLHIQPPELEFPELVSEDNWLLEPQKNVSYRQSIGSLTSYKTSLLNNGIPIRPGEIITANADVIIGTPNGIQFSLAPANGPQNYNAGAPESPSQSSQPQSQPQNQNQVQPQSATYHQNVQPFKKKTWLPNVSPPRVIPLNPGYVGPVPSNRPLLENYDNILKPPPMLQPYQQMSGASSKHLLRAPPAPQAAHLKPIYDNPHNIRSYNSHHYNSPQIINLNSELNNNEIIEIKRIPEIFSTKLPAVTQTHIYASSYYIQPQHQHQPQHQPQLQLQLQHQPLAQPQQQQQPHLHPHPQLQYQAQQQPIYQLRPTVTYGSGAGAGSVSPAYSAHQHINLKTDVLSHTVKMHVPPLTFKKETDDFPHATAVKGQIAPQPMPMPLVKIPLNEAHVQVRLTPQNTGLGLALVTQDSNANIIRESSAFPTASIFKQRNQNVIHANPHIPVISPDRSAAFDINYRPSSTASMQAISQNIPQSSANNIFTQHLLIQTANPSIVAGPTKTVDVSPYTVTKTFAKWGESTALADFGLSTMRTPAYHRDLLHESKYRKATQQEPFKVPQLYEESPDDEAALQQDQKAAYTTYNSQTTNLTQANSGEVLPDSIFNYYTIKGNGLEHSPEQQAFSERPQKVLDPHPSMSNTWTSLATKVNASSSVPLHQGSPFVARNRTDQKKASSATSEYGAKKIYIAAGERFKLKPAESSSIEFNRPATIPTQPSTRESIQPFGLSDNYTKYATTILMPPLPTASTYLNLNSTTRTNAVQDVLGMKPPPPPPPPTMAVPPSKYPPLTTNVDKVPQLMPPQPSAVVPGMGIRSGSSSKVNIAQPVLRPPPRPQKQQPSSVIQSKTNYHPSTISQTFKKLEPSEVTEHYIQFTTQTTTIKTKVEEMVFTEQSKPPIESTTTSSIALAEGNTLKLSDPLYSYKVSVKPTKTESPILRVSSTIYSSNASDKKSLDSSSYPALESSETFDSAGNSLKESVSGYSNNLSHFTFKKATKATQQKPNFYSTTAPVLKQTDPNRSGDFNPHNKFHTTETTEKMVPKATTPSTTSTNSHKTPVKLPSQPPMQPQQSKKSTVSKVQRPTVPMAKTTKVSASSIAPTTTRQRLAPTSVHRKTPESPKVQLPVESEGEAKIDIHPLVPTGVQKPQHKLEPPRTRTESSSEPSSILVVMSKSNMGNSNNVIEVPVPQEYDSNIAFDFPTRDEDIEPPIDANSVLLGGVLIATPSKTKITKESANACSPSCKSSKNEMCTSATVGSIGHCECRPGFARMFPDRPCKPTYTYEMQIQTNQVGNYMLKYSDGLRSSSSNEYRHLSSIILDAVDRMVMQSDFRDVYHRVQLRGFDIDRDNGVIGNFLLQLSENSDENRLESIFKKYLRLSNYSIGGTELYTSKKGVNSLEIKDFDECSDDNFHDCSVHAQCFNLVGSYTCSCRDGYVDLSENSIYPGRQCSDHIIGCDKCNYHGNCVASNEKADTIVCECFAWHAGATCQLNLKILLICLIAVGTVLFILLLFCILLMYIRRKMNGSPTHSPIFITSSLHPSMLSASTNKSRLTTSLIRRSSIENHAIIKDSSSESSQNSVPYLLKEAIAVSMKRETAKAVSSNNVSERPKMKSYRNKYDELGLTEAVDEQPLRSHSRHPNFSTVDVVSAEQSDRSLTVMIPRAKYYHPSVLPHTQLMHHQLTMEKVERPSVPQRGGDDAQRHASSVFMSPAEKSKQPKTTYNNDNSKDQGALGLSSKDYGTPIGALVSAGFEVSAIVSDHGAVSSSSGQNVIPFGITRHDNSKAGSTETDNAAPSEGDHTILNTRAGLEAILHSGNDIHRMSTWMSNMQTNAVSADARSFDETTVQAVTKSMHLCFDTQTQTNTNEEANTMTERDLGSTFLLPHTHLYKPDKESDMSGFDSI